MQASIVSVDTRVPSKRPRAQDVDVHIGSRLRQRRVMNGLTQQKMAELIGVTYQQAHKYENGFNRVSASRLYLIAHVLGVDVQYFFEGLQTGLTQDQPPQQRVFLELARNFRSIRKRKHQEAICQLTRILAQLEESANTAEDDDHEWAESA